ncbi:MAG TPA: winged helix-turn-helix domain-containing protein [Xanthomonadales bacterium]|nr:winged helix-turn-helix domain-containing protein [Xanthomonadales bacterium]
MTVSGKDNHKFTVGDWCVDPERLKIRRRNQPEIQLTPRAMDVLLMLADAEGHVVHKNDLLDQVWPRAEVTQGVLSQAILELRNAVNDQSNSPYFIETVRGRGFRLIPPVRKTGDGANDHSSSTKVDAGGRRVAHWLFGALLIGVMGMGAAFLYFKLTSAPSLPSEPTLLVVPFEDLSEQSDHDYLARGMAEEIAVQLSAAPELRLISNRTFSPYLAQADDPIALAQEFGVDLILTGSVQPQNDRIRLVAELADARSAEQIWVSSFSRSRADVFAIQDEVAKSIADLLLERDFIPRRNSPIGSLRAYDYYLQGRQYLSKVDPESTARAERLFRQSLELDAKFAPALASLATAHAMQGFLYQQGREKLELALDEADQAVSIDSESAEAHYASALALLGLARFKESRSKVEQAASLSPSHVDAVFLAGALSDMRGEWVAAVEYYQRALELNPRLPRTVALARIIFLLGDKPRAIAIARRGVDLQPDVTILYFAHLNTLMEQHDDALAYCQQAVRNRVPRARNLCGFSAFVAGESELASQWLSEDWVQSPRPQWGPFTFAASATHLAALKIDEGDVAGASELLRQSREVTLNAIESGNDHWALRYNMALLSSLAGEPEDSIQWLADSFENGFRDHRLLAIDPALSGVRQRPEFKEFQRKVGFYSVYAAERLEVGGLNGH